MRLQPRQRWRESGRTLPGRWCSPCAKPSRTIRAFVDCRWIPWDAAGALASQTLRVGRLVRDTPRSTAHHGSNVTPPPDGIPSAIAPSSPSGGRRDRTAPADGPPVPGGFANRPTRVRDAHESLTARHGAFQTRAEAANIERFGTLHCGAGTRRRCVTTSREPDAVRPAACARYPLAAPHPRHTAIQPPPPWNRGPYWCRPAPAVVQTLHLTESTATAPAEAV